MATYIWGCCDNDVVYGDYLYAKLPVNGLAPWNHVDRTVGNWTIGEYSRPDGDNTVYVARYQYEKDSQFYFSVNLDSSKIVEGIPYDYCGTLVCRFVGGSTTMEVPYTNTNTSFQLTVSTTTEWVLVPVYIATQFTLTCDGNGGIPAVQTVVFRAGNYVVLPQAPARAGYSFDGWKIGGSVYGAGESVQLSADTTATAQWVSSGPIGSGSGLLGATQGGSLAFNQNSSSLVYN